MIVAGLQFDLAWEDPEANLRRAGAWIAAAADRGARIVALPEMFATAFTMDAQGAAANAPQVLAFLADEARRHGCWVLAGLAVPGAPRPRNAAVLLDPEGRERLRYEKIHPFTLAGEPDHYDAGDRLATVDVEGLRVTPLICYDLRFPEPFRIAAADTDLFIVVANWPERRAAAWRTLVRARAIENQAFLLAVNRVGDACGVAHSGDSVLLDPFGGEVASPHADEGLVIGSVSAEDVADARSRYSFLADRRDEVYGRLRGDSREEKGR